MSAENHESSISSGWDEITVSCSCGESFREWVSSQDGTREEKHAASMRAHDRYLKHLEEMLIREKYR